MLYYIIIAIVIRWRRRVLSKKKATAKNTNKNPLLEKAATPVKWYYIFAFLLVYSFVVVRRCRIPSMEDVVYSFHAVDFSMGFCSRFLPGAIFNFIFKTPTILKATIYETVLLVGFFAVLSVFLSKISKSLAPDNRPAFLLLALFFLTGPGTFSIYSYQIGMLDVYWMFFGAIFFVLLKNRYLRWLIPFICGLCVMVHQSALLCYVPLMALIIFTEAVFSSPGKEQKIFYILFFATCIVSIVVFLYFAVYDSKNFAFHMDVFAAKLRERGAVNCDYYEDYSKVTANLVADGILTPEEAEYYSNPILISPEKSPVFASFINMLWKRYKLLTVLYSLEVYKKALIRQLILYILFIPLLSVMYKYYITSFRTDGKKDIRFVFFCIMIYFPVLSLMTPFLSTDTVRWMSHSFTVPFVFLIYMIYKKKDTIMQSLTQTCKKVPLPVIIIYFLVYACTVFDPYIIIG